jgi:hypothetical protein
MSAVRIGFAAVLVAIALLAALLAADVRSWRSAIAQGDAMYVVTPKQAAWSPSTWLGGSARTLLGVGPDLEQRHALQLYLNARSIPDRLDTATELQSVRAQAEDALDALARGRHASQADTLLGILAFDAAATGTGPGGSGADAAIADFTDAVRTDPENAAAKFDLELLLRLTAAQGSRPGSGAGGSIGKGGRRGAGGGLPGSGY